MDNERIIYISPALHINIHGGVRDSNYELRGMHFHTAIELVRANLGEMRCEFGEHDITFKSGEILLINSCIRHKISVKCGVADFSYIQIDMSSYLPGLTGENKSLLGAFMQIAPSESYKVYSTGSEIDRLFSSILTEYKVGAPYFESFIKADIYKLAAMMQREGFLRGEASGIQSPAIAKIMPAVRYAEENLSKDITLDDICRFMRIDKTYFCRLFKSATSGKFIDYVNFLRIHKAEEMLIGTDKTVSEIAYECGFSTMQYFNRIFKKKNNCTPSEYKSLHFSAF